VETMLYPQLSTVIYPQHSLYCNISTTVSTVTYPQVLLYCNISTIVYCNISTTVSTVIYHLLFYRNYICMLWTGFIEDCCEYDTLEKMLWICYSGDCCGYAIVDTVVDMSQWRLCWSPL
jgi:hypothetical protein